MIIKHYRDELDKIRLDKNTDANQYINRFIICSKKLEDKGKGHTVDTKCNKFLDQIVDDDYNIVVQNL